MSAFNDFLKFNVNTKPIGNLLKFRFSLRNSVIGPEMVHLMLLVHGPYFEKHGPTQYVSLSLT